VADTYNPGSTFKVVTAVTALDEGVVDQDDRTVCRGSIELGKRRFRCTHNHGPVDAETAMIQSCNIYFYELGGKAGMMNRIAARAKDFGLGEVTGLGINGEVAGLVPTEEWHNARRSRGEAFSMGHALNTAIGEGATRVTVLQMALLYAAIANGGHLMAPQLVERVETATGQVVARFPAQERRRVNISPETLAYLHRALAGVMNDRRGTAYRARSQKVTMAGKTGTATTHLSRKREANAAASGHNDHAWFAGYAPVDHPQVAFAVLVEHGGFGGEVAAPVARQLVEAALLPPLAQTETAPAKVAESPR
jgi:penicillin-binding protein 2